MKICKVRPVYSTCSACIATQEIFNVVDDCGKCKLNTDTYELLQVGTGFWSGDYAMEPMEKLVKALNDAIGRMYSSKEETYKIRTGRKHKSVKRVPDSKMSTYNYMPAVKHNLPYQRRNF